MLSATDGVAAHFSLWVNRLRPRRRLGHDPLLPVAAAQRFAPITVARLRVIAPLAGRILALRRPCSFDVRRDQRLTVVIPFRDRDAHLGLLLPRLRAVVASQGIDCRVLVVEQAPGKLFNRGKLLNVGCRLAWDESDYFVFHDVDMIPESAEYGCPSQPLRLITRMTYSHRGRDYMGGSYFGGTVALAKPHLEAINGLSNGYWGWGKEDDDLLLRCLLRGLVPHEDREGLYADLDTPAAEVPGRDQVIRRGTNRKLRDRVFRLQVDPFAAGLAEVDYRVLAESRGADLWRVTVAI
jgi:hypothetical protein